MNLNSCENQDMLVRRKFVRQHRSIRNRVNDYFSVIVRVDMWHMMFFRIPEKHPNEYSLKHRNGWHWGTLSLLRHATALSGGNSIAFPIQGGGLWFVQPGAQNQILVGTSFMGVFRHSWLLSRGGEGFSISASQRHQNPNNRPAFLIETSATSSSVRPSIAATPARLYRIFAGTLGLSGACAGGMSGLSVSMRKASG